MTVDDTTALSYWLNWRFFSCAAFLLISMVFAALLIWKYEGFNKSNRDRRENEKLTSGFLFEDEVWKTCLKAIHPVWLLGFRLIAFAMLMAMLVANITIDGAGVFYFYTQWTFSLVTIYFGLGSALSVCGCCQNRNRVDGYTAETGNIDSEQGSYAAPTIGANEDASNIFRSPDSFEEPHARKTVGAGGYIFQIVYQMSAGAVVLTDSVFWLVLYPFLTSDNYRLNFLIICMHSLNAVFLIGDTILNCLPFPVFRMAYFIMFTAVFVIFQWIIHAFVSLWWPYPFLDLSSEYAPLWYFGVGLMHIPCYGIYAFIVKLKHFWYEDRSRNLI